MPEPTAGRSAGTEQGQGREVCAVDGCGHPKADHDYLDDRGACAVMKPGGLEYLDGCMGYQASPSVPPARDSGLSERSVTFTEDSGRDAATEPGPGLERDPDGATRVGASSGRDEAREQRWRTGRRVGRTIYAQRGPDPSDDDLLIGVMDTTYLARAAVDGHNALLRDGTTT